MGLLRILLALAVLTAHAPTGTWFLGGQLAVEGFYVISGFYIAMILGKGSYPTLSAFYTARWLRLWPLYIFVAVASFGLLLAGGINYGNVFLQQGLGMQMLMGFSHIFMFGLDWLYGLSTSTNLLVIPQAWSLAIEVCFVVVAPLLVKWRTEWLVGLMVATQVVRWCVIGWDDSSFMVYRFFPFELGVFVLGILGYRMMEAKYKLWSPARLGWAVMVFPLMLAVLVLPVPAEVQRLIWLGGVFVAAPMLFVLCKGSRLDTWVGELSYPVYLWHWVLLLVVGKVVQGNPVVVTVVGMALTLVVSAVSLVMVQWPVDRLRHKLRR